jgi:DNA-binding PucR family transcriptional regulator
LANQIALENRWLSYQHAHRAFEVGSRFGRKGIIDLTKLGPLPLLGVDTDAAPFLVDVHLAPLLELGDLSTVKAYLQHDRRIDRTAAQPFLHRNTVRNRVVKVTDLTGLDLDRTEDLVLAWWLLNIDTRGSSRQTAQH